MCIDPALVVEVRDRSLLHSPSSILLFHHTKAHAQHLLVANECAVRVLQQSAIRFFTPLCYPSRSHFIFCKQLFLSFLSLSQWCDGSSLSLSLTVWSFKKKKLSILVCSSCPHFILPQSSTPLAPSPPSPSRLPVSCLSPRMGSGC